MHKPIIAMSFIFILSLACSSFSAADPLACPDVSQVASGKFMNVYQSDKDAYMVYGFFNVNHDIYQRWGLMIYDFKNSTIPGALLAANAALRQQHFSKVTEQADCSGGNRGSVCQCTYQINIANENGLQQYKMYAEAMS